jgi:hypothetical protein
MKRFLVLLILFALASAPFWAQTVIVVKHKAAAGGSIGAATNTGSPGNYLYRSTSLPTASAGTISGWFKVNALSGGTYPTMICFNGSSTYLFMGFTNGTNGLVEAWGGSFTSTVATLAVNDWAYIAITFNGSTLTAYAKKNGGASSTATTSQQSIGSVSNIRILQDGSNNDAGAFNVDYVRVWSSVLTQSQLDTESGSASAVITSNLLSDSPLPNNTTLNGWSINGSLSNGGDCPYVSH